MMNRSRDLLFLLCFEQLQAGMVDEGVCATEPRIVADGQPFRLTLFTC